MSTEVTEALLEMHFHRAILECFKDIYGANFLRLLKPSAQNEAWVGFDQGWSHTGLSNAQLLEELKQAVASGKASVPSFYVGYFMQFKTVQHMHKRTKYAPAS